MTVAWCRCVVAVQFCRWFPASWRWRWSPAIGSSASCSRWRLEWPNVDRRCWSRSSGSWPWRCRRRYSSRVASSSVSGSTTPRSGATTRGHRSADPPSRFLSALCGGSKFVSVPDCHKHYRVQLTSDPRATALVERLCAIISILYLFIHSFYLVWCNDSIQTNHAKAHNSINRHAKNTIKSSLHHPLSDKQKINRT